MDSMECKVQGTLFIVGLAVPGDEELKLVTKLGKKFGVTDDIYRILKRAGIIDHADEVISKFTHIFDDIVKHGDDAARALDDLVKAGVSKEAVEEAVKHGATIKAVKEGIERFAKSTSPIKNSYGYTIIIERGNEKYGLIHGWLRHVHGYEMDYKRETSFFPMGQEIVYYVNGQKKTMKLPKTIQSPEELYNEIVRLIEQHKDKLTGDYTVVLHVQSSLPGIDKITLVFKKAGSRQYKLITFWPKSGSAVFKFERGGTWYKYDPLTGKWRRI
ncbi:hypothetical protein A3L14_06910 [Thermococcus thioreducens]|nr:hypothetical protein A3L14_06910 [Thermococcus thioreducens]